jgi:leader peptidase (prepilin peptidase)/N-methyltransferase
MIAGPAAWGLAGGAGLVLGSFAVTAGLRVGRGEQVFVGRSHCDGCLRPLRFVETVPVVSYLTRIGACAACGARIDPVHMVGELAGGAIVLGSLLVAEPTRALVLAALGLTLTTSATVDWRRGRLPDLLTAGVAVLAATLALLTSGQALLIGLTASVLTGGVLLGLRRAFTILHRDPGLGLGDVKLLAALAIWLGPATAWAVAVAAGAGLLLMVMVRPADGRLAFGPALAMAGFAVGLMQEAHLWPMMM